MLDPLTQSKTQLHLGATMYVPCSQKPEALAAIANGEKFPQLRSVVFCTEDAVREDQLNQALENLKQALRLFRNVGNPMRFIRVRNPHVMGRCIAFRGIEQVDGFVLPKVTAESLPFYLSQLSSGDSFSLMPTLETVETFDAVQRLKLKKLLLRDNVKKRILCLRIGGNDLLNCIGQRRPKDRTIYDTPVGALISELVCDFLPSGFGLSAPVFELIDEQFHPLLEEEIRRDLVNGLFGKTAIHPTQIGKIENMFKVDPSDVAEAEAILAPDAQAVFRMGGRMCEPNTHSDWARNVLSRAEIYGMCG
ncbi:MAG: HpcH/HpaI aldolase/citrate lyase family protein [Candidatus Melainabacteria bacterium]|nr:HpcH/HpaI aldolase/citrate lyase family protein [Candidatus Melainabacteria bacterium]